MKFYLTESLWLQKWVGTWKKYVGVPYTLSARTENVLPYLDLFQNQLT